MATDIFQIEKGIPAPTNQRARFPFEKMEVGDGFFADGITQSKVYSAVTYRKNRYGEKYVCRAVEDGFRVWRTA